MDLPFFPGVSTMLGDFSRRGDRLDERKAWLEFEVHAFTLHHQRPVLYVGMDRADVLADDPHGNQLDGTEEEDTDHQGCDANREPIPLEQFIEEICQSCEDTECR